LGYISGAPYFAKAREYEVYGISAEYAAYHGMDWRIYPQSSKLHPPTDGTKYLGRYAEQERYANPPKIALTHFLPHLPEVDTVK
jgi:hypothetical protein